LSGGGFARAAAKPKPAKPKRIHSDHSLCFFPASLASPSKEFIPILDFYYQKFVGALSVPLDEE
jgi:hypothetical protein